MDTSNGNLVDSEGRKELIKAGMSGLIKAAPFPTPGQIARAKIGRNEVCPCGSKKEDGTRKKFKNCCWTGDKAL